MGTTRPRWQVEQGVLWYPIKTKRHKRPKIFVTLYYLSWSLALPYELIVVAHSSEWPPKLFYNSLLVPQDISSSVVSNLIPHSLIWLHSTFHNPNSSTRPQSQTSRGTLSYRVCFRLTLSSPTPSPCYVTYSSVWFPLVANLSPDSHRTQDYTPSCITI